MSGCGGDDVADVLLEAGAFSGRGVEFEDTDDISGEDGDEVEGEPDVGDGAREGGGEA